MLKRIVFLCIALLACANTLSATTEEQRRLESRIRADREIWLRSRIYAVRPQRRDGPAREHNISDEEVQEIRITAREIQPGALINIGTVVLGCACEDGPLCKEQVWIESHLPQKTTGLLLSRVKGHWTIGIVQQWWLELEKLEARRKDFANWNAYEEARKEHWRKCNACTPANLEKNERRTERHDTTFSLLASAA